jgi:hypothetical protein
VAILRRVDPVRPPSQPPVACASVGGLCTSCSGGREGSGLWHPDKVFAPSPASSLLPTEAQATVPETCSTSVTEG